MSERSHSLSCGILPNWRGRPNVLAGAQLLEVKEIAGAALRIDDIIAIGHAVLMMTSSHVLVRNIGSLELSIPWAKRIRENIGYTLRKGTADKNTFHNFSQGNKASISASYIF